jgi:hypothetical protein
MCKAQLEVIRKGIRWAWRRPATNFGTIKRKDTLVLKSIPQLIEGDLMLLFI